MEFAVTGASGQMGASVIETIESMGHRVCFCCDREESLEDTERNAKADSKIRNMVEQHEPDAIIDFTVPEATVNYLDVAEKTMTPMVIGTTGFSEAQKEAIEQAADAIPIVKASNFSPSITVMKELVEEACSKLESYDVEITETHHRRKKDAPSGTAQSLVNAVEKATGNKTKKHGREGDSLREGKEIGVHSKRAGDIRGKHEVLLAGANEIMKISHRSESRKVFSSGAVKAAVWVSKAGTGLHSFERVLEQPP
jgi:dihydrodipicolinate reductase